MKKAHFVVSRFTTLYLGAGRGLQSLVVAIPGDVFVLFLNTFRTEKYNQEHLESKSKFILAKKER